MLSFFRTNQPLANIFLLVYLLIVRVSTFVHPLTSVPKSQGILTQWMYMEVSPNSFVAHIMSFLLIFVQAIFINITISRFRVTGEMSLLPGLFYCLVSSFIPEFLTLSPILLANTFLIVAMFYMFDIYKNNYASSRIFDVGLWIGVASLFHFSYLVFVLWGFVGLGILRGIRPKELLMLLFGFAIPFFLFWVFLFWNDKGGLLGKHFTDNLGFLSFVKNSNPTTYVKLGVMGLMITILLLASSLFFSKRTISTQKFISIVYWMLLISGFSILIQSNLELNHLLILTVPMGILLSMLFLRIKSATAEALHLVFLAVALVLQFEYMLLIK
jgi:hypothetical protein